MLLLGRTSVNLNVLPAADLGPTEPESYHNPWCTARWSSVLRRSSRCCAEPSKQRRNQHPSKGVELGEPRTMVRRGMGRSRGRGERGPGGAGEGGAGQPRPPGARYPHARPPPPPPPP